MGGLFVCLGMCFPAWRRTELLKTAAEQISTPTYDRKVNLALWVTVGIKPAIGGQVLANLGLETDFLMHAHEILGFPRAPCQKRATSTLQAS